MPGPSSDSYDPEFGTGANAVAVADAVREILEGFRRHGWEKKPILEVVRGDQGKWYSVELSEKALLVILFALERALEDI